MSPIMKKMTRRYLWILAVALLYCTAISFCLAGLGMKAFYHVENVETPEPFQVYEGAEIYSYLDAHMMSAEFASDFKETNHYYFVYDQDYSLYIVKIHGNLSYQSQRLQDYFYSEDEEAPEPVTFYGMTAPIEDDIRQYAIESYNEMWEKEILTEDNFSDYFGEYYLDTARKPVPAGTNHFNTFFFTAALFAFYATLILINCLRNPRRRITKATLRSLTTQQLLEVDGQINSPLTFVYQKGRLYLTADYLVANVQGFEVLPYGEIERIYDINALTVKRLMAQTKDQKCHVLAVDWNMNARHKERFQSLADQVKRTVRQRQEEFSEKTDQSPSPEQLKAEAYDPDFSKPWHSTLQPLKEERRERLLPGMIGAFFGALLGAIFWIVIGQLGYIAGLAGLAILKLSLLGYEKLGGALKKRGAIICLVLSAAMILAANLADYGVSLVRAYFEYEASLETFLYVFSNFGILMSATESWGNFYFSLILGYALSLLSCMKTIREIFRMEE